MAIHHAKLFSQIQSSVQELEVTIKELTNPCDVNINERDKNSMIGLIIKPLCNH
jgi:hypothetical protein